MRVNIQIREEGPIIAARLEGADETTPALCTVSRAACDADETLFEDFQAMAVKVLSTMVGTLDGDAKAVGYFTKKPGDN